MKAANRSRAVKRGRVLNRVCWTTERYSRVKIHQGTILTSINGAHTYIHHFYTLNGCQGVMTEVRGNRLSGLLQYETQAGFKCEFKYELILN